MGNTQSLSHSRWDCKYHVVFVPKRRRKELFGHLRQKLGPLFRDRARQKEGEISEGHTSAEHVHRCLAIPPKHAVASVRGCIKRKRALRLARLRGKERNCAGESFWARGYDASTVGLNEEQLKRYIREQEGSDESGRF
ncbi:MAG: IS200/IS605 family transposase [Acidobacteria bacterium]|nr:IS200/IS605 family transposase [Acidobacteriota bacterium]MBI3427164.1 IS200/IS605 family transposase [Acidobacteriota bacterium]